MSLTASAISVSGDTLTTFVVIISLAFIFPLLNRLEGW
jgi:hypothetical protein